MTSLKQLACVLGMFVLLSPLALAEEPTYGKVTVDEVVSIYDGDTFTVTIRNWPAIVGDRISVRIYGIDTPEMRDERPRVQALARAAKQRVVQRLREGKRIELRNLRRDKYFRVLAEVWVDGRSLADELVAAGLAHPYDGGTKQSW